MSYNRYIVVFEADVVGSDEVNHLSVLRYVQEQIKNNSKYVSALVRRQEEGAWTSVNLKTNTLSEGEIRLALEQPREPPSPEELEEARRYLEEVEQGNIIPPILGGPRSR